MKAVDKDIQSILKKYQFTFHKLAPDIVMESAQFSSFDKLFYEAFPKLSFVHKEKINYLSDLLYIAVMTTDRIVDDQQEAFREELIFFSKLLWEKAQVKMRQLFSDDDPFWQYYEKYNIEFTVACIREHQNHFHQLSVYSGKDFREISAGKAAIAKLPITAMCLLAERVADIPAFELSIDQYFIGLQVKDDLVDWRIDWRKKRYSFLLSKIIYLKKWEKELDKLEEDDIGRVIFYADHAFSYLEGAYKAYQKSLTALANIPCPDWEKFVQKCSEDIRDLQVHIRDTVDKEIERIEI